MQYLCACAYLPSRAKSTMGRSLDGATATTVDVVRHVSNVEVDRHVDSGEVDSCVDVVELD